MEVAKLALENSDVYSGRSDPVLLLYVVSAIDSRLSMTRSIC
jgi:hypothetical protein